MEIETPPAQQDLAQPSCLLAIPRELRDQIYGYLHRPNKFSCRTRSTGGDISIHVEQSPIIEVLLTCSRLHHEYLDSSVYTQLTAIMDTSVATKWHVKRPALHTNSLVTAGLLDRTSDASPMSDAALNQVLACLKHIVWILNDRTGKPPWGVALSQVRGITNTLEELCHSLVSFKVGIKTEVERDIVECKRSERLAGNHPIINHSLAFLQLQGLLSAGIDHFTPDTRETYNTWRVDVLLYVKPSDMKKDSLWTREQVTQIMPEKFCKYMMERGRDPYTNMYRDRLEVDYGYLAHDVLGWREKIGAELCLHVKYKDGYYKR